MPDLSKLTAVASGKIPVLTQEAGRMNEKMLIVFNGVLNTPAAGSYRFNMTTYGYGSLKVDGKPVIPWGNGDLTGQVDLPAGIVPVEIIYSKPVNWYPNGLALTAVGPGFRPTALHALSSLAPSNPDRPITVTVGEEPEILRSFMDYSDTDTGKTHRIVRAISVGFPHKTSLSYNGANGALYQAWKGGFLDASPMWNSRGDGNSKPIGDVLKLGDRPTLVRLTTPDAVLPDTMPNEAGYRFMGYSIQEAVSPMTFRYEAWGYTCADAVMSPPKEGGKSIQRWLLINRYGAPAANVYYLVATGSSIESLPDHMYIVDGRYYIHLMDNAENPLLRTVGNRQELLVPALEKKDLHYSLSW
jgi:hypothetical protein